jgi:putative flippase GtrA
MDTTSILNFIDAFTLKLIRALIRSPQRQETLHQFIKFGLIGVINTFIDFGIYFMLTRHTHFFGAHLLVANFISFTTGTTFSFFANRTWTFLREDKATINEAVRFYATTISGLLLSQGILFAFLNWFHVYDLIAKAFTTIFTIFWNFLLKKFFVFVPPKAEV